MNKSILLASALLCFSVTGFAAEPCAEHDGIPIYCDFTTESHLEIDGMNLTKYAPRWEWGIGATCHIGGACKQNEVWFDGPAVPAPSKADVTARVEFQADVYCSTKSVNCEQFRRSAQLLRLELVVDGKIVDTYVVDGSNTHLEHEPFFDDSVWKITSAKETYLAGRVGFGQKVSVRATPLMPNESKTITFWAGYDGFDIDKVRITFNSN